MTDVVIKSIYKKSKKIYSKDFVLRDPSFGKKSSLILTATTDYIRHTSVITSVTKNEWRKKYEQSQPINTARVESMTQPEHIIQNKIRLALSANQCTVFRINVGKVRLPDGTLFQTGVPRGFPDLAGFKWSDGRAFFIEVKTQTGRPRQDQIQFHKMLTSHGIIHGLARSPEDAVKIVKEGLVGYGY